MYDDTQMTADTKAARACRGRAKRHDLGSAMLVVMGAASILFVIAAAVIGVVVFQQGQQVRAQSVSRATALAQQGMEVYLSALRIDPDYWETTPTIAGKGQDGTWTVVANVPSSTITAVGRESVSGMMHVIRAGVRPENAADYTIFSGAGLTLGRSDDSVHVAGTVRSNASVDLAQDYPGVTVYAADPASVAHASRAGGGVKEISSWDFSEASNDFPNLFTASWQRDRWATGASLPDEAADLVKPMTFYRDSNRPSRSYWGASSEPAPNINATDLVGVGIDFKHVSASEKSIGLFYIRSMWSPYNIYDNPAAAAGKASITRQEFIDFARQDPTWNTNGWATPEISSRPKSITARALEPDGNNVVYVGGDLDVYVTGEVSKSVTIVSERDIYIIGDITRAANTTATVGLIAKRNIYICGAMPRSTDNREQYVSRTGETNALTDQTYWRGARTGSKSANGKAAGETMGNDVVIKASMMAVNGAIIMDPGGATDLPADFRPLRSTLTINGSLIARDGLTGPNFVSEATSTGGFDTTYIASDTTSGTVAPPLFPQTGSGALKVTTWDESSTNVDPNADFTFPEPGDYTGADPGTADLPLPIVTPVDSSDTPLTTSNAMPSYTGQAVITLSVTDASNAGVWQTWWRVLDEHGNELLHGTGRTIEIPPLADNEIATRTVEFQSQDNDGHMEPWRSVTFVMRGRDTDPPKTTVIDSDNPGKSLPDGFPQKQFDEKPYVVWGQFVPQFTSAERFAAGLGVREISVHLDKMQGSTVVDSWTGEWAGKQTPLNFAPVQPPDVGSVDLSYKYFAYDNAGNREDVRTLTVTQRALDITGPFITHDAPSAWLFVGPAKIHLTADDGPEGQGVGSVSYQKDNDDWVTIKSDSPTRSVTVEVTFTAPPMGTPAVEHTLKYMAVDVATDRFHQPSPNNGYLYETTLTVGPALAADTTPPESGSDAQPSYIGPASISLFSSDAGGVANIFWSLDGGETNTGATVYVDSPWTGVDRHTLSFWAVDVAGNREDTKTVSFTVSPEREAPTTIAFNEKLYNTASATFLLIATDNEGGSGLRVQPLSVPPMLECTYYRVNGGSVSTALTTADGKSNITTSGDGVKVVDYWSVDNAGNREATKTVQFTIDTLPPTTGDDAKSTTYSGQATVTLSPQDSGSGVAYTRWSNPDNGYVQVSNPVLLGPGSWNIEYWSVDNAGNQEARKSFHVTVAAGPDSTPPSSYDNHKPYYKAGSNPAEIDLFSWDVQSGVRTMNFILDGAAAETRPGVGMPPADYKVFATGDRAHTLEYWSQDASGNVEAPHKVATFTIDTIDPDTTCSAEAGGQYWTSQNFSLVASDTGSGIDGTYYKIDGGLTIKGTAVYVPTPVRGYAVPHTITYWSVDKAGNVEPATSVSFTSHPLDTIAPWTSSNLATAYAGRAVIGLTPHDNVGGSGVADTRYILDTQPERSGTVLMATGSGVHRLEFWSMDKANNVELPHNVATFTVDYFGPVTQCDALRWYNAAATVKLVGQNLGSNNGLANTYYQLDSAGVTEGTPPTTTVLVSGEGTHYLRYWSKDIFGNTEVAKTATIGIDSRAPRTTSTAVGSYSGTAFFTLTPKDETDGSGIKNTYWKVPGGTTHTGISVEVAGPGGSSTVATSVLFWSEDNAGNAEPANRVDFTIGPKANLTFTTLVPAENTTITVRETTVSASAMTTGSTITSATGMIDGVPMPITFSSSITTVGGSVPPTFSVSGGIQTIDGTRTVVTFRSSGSLVCSGSLGGVQVLVVGGGGGGDSNLSGAGGGGGVVTSTVTLSGTIPVTVGGGGYGTAWAYDESGCYAQTYISGPSTNGGNSSFGALGALGGGHGGQRDLPSFATAGGSGGGGGGAYKTNNWIAGLGTAGQGYAGGAGTGSPTDPGGQAGGGGGGGAAGVGSPGYVQHGGAGGPGRLSTIGGSAKYYGGGGGGGSYYYSGAGGVGGGGNGEPYPTPGAANTGGGGGAGLGASGAGGSGIVIISFPTPTSTTIPVISTTNATASFRAKNLADGEHWASVTFINALGEANTRLWRFFEKGPADLTSPVTTSDVTATAVYTTGSGNSLTGFYRPGTTTVKLAASDEVGGTGVASTRYTTGGAPLYGTPPTTTLTFTGEGPHPLAFWSTDNAGNVEATKNVNVYIDGTAPVTTNDAAPTYKGVANFSLVATDNGGSGVKTTYYSVDGGGTGASFNATGGVKTRTTVNGVSYDVITFANSGSLVCSGTLTGASVLVVGGGGGGMPWSGGGGGGGGVIASSAVTLAGTIPITVGTGGGVGVYSTGPNHLPSKGNNSAFASLTAIGGGYGASRDIAGAAGTGGSGGGGAGAYLGNWAGAAGTAGPPRQGNNGGNGTGNPTNLEGNSGGGGGGGANSTGGVGAYNLGGAGGAGIASSITGSQVYYGGGGGGAAFNSAVEAAGGIGGGGNGERYCGGGGGGSAGTANTGGGGGGSTLGNGGSGIVIVSYPTPAGAVQQGTSISVDGPLNGDPVTRTVRYWSVDNVGNVESEGHATFTISADDRTAPTTTSNVSSPYHLATSTITLTAWDAGSGVDHTMYRLTKNGVTGSDTTYTAPIPVGTQGVYQLVFWSVDRNGNTEVPPAPANYLVDQTPPVTTDSAYPVIVVEPVSVLTTITVSGGGNQTFTAVGAQSFTVPVGVTSLGVTINGAGGGAGRSANDDITKTPGGAGGLSSVVYGGTSYVAYGGSGGSGTDGNDYGGTNGANGSTSLNAGWNSLVGGGAAGGLAAGGSGGGWVLGGDGGSGGKLSGQLTVTPGAVVTVNVGAGGAYHVNGGAGASGSVTFTWSAAQQRQDFGFTGGDQSFTVPAGITALTVDLYGSVGGDYYDYVGGAGGGVHAVVPVTPGQVLTVRVGGQGTYGYGPGGWPNGGWSGHGGGGGGSTSLLAAGSIWAEAGGGGGGSCDDGDGGPGGRQGWLPGGNQTGGTGQGSGGGGGWNGGAGMISSHEADPGEGGTSYIAAGIGSLAEGANGGLGSATMMWGGSSTVTTTTLVGGFTTINLSATDIHTAATGVQGTYWMLDDQPATWNSGTTISVQGPASGTTVHHIDYYSKDFATNAEPTKTTTFTLVAAATPMEWSDWAPAKSSLVTVRNPLISVQGKAQEQVTAVDAWLDGTRYYPDLSGPADQRIKTAQFRPTNLEDGTHTVTFTYTVAGVKPVSETWTFGVAGPDNVMPHTSSDATLTYEGTATIHLSPIDYWPGHTPSGIKSTNYSVDDGTLQSGLVITVNPPARGAGVVHHIDYWSVDNRDNEELPHHTATFTVSPTRDTTAPRTTSDLLPSYDGPATIHLFAQDNADGGWGIANTYYKLDGNPRVTYSSAINIDPPSGGSDGHTLEYWSTDLAGNEETHTVAPFTINSLEDKTAPITTVIPSQRYFQALGSFRFSATDNQYGSGVDYTKYKITPGTALTTYTVPFSTGQQNHYTLEYWSKDKAGNQETTKSLEYWVDWTAPVTTCDASSTYLGFAVMSLTATDFPNPGGSGVYRTQYRIDNGTWVTGTSPYVDGPVLGSAGHTVDYRSQDWAGNIENYGSKTFTINALPATIAFSAQTPTGTVDHRDVVVSVRGQAAQNITNVTAQIDGGAPFTPTRFANGSQMDFTAQFSRTLLDGVHNVSFTYIVANGSQAMTSWSFTVAGPDNVAPHTTSDVQPSYEGTANISLTATDDPNPVGHVSGVKYTYYILNGDVQRTYTTTITVAPPVNGTAPRSIQFWSVDASGNIETWHSAPFNITAARDTTAPRTVCSAATTYTGQATGISLTASDNVGGWGLARTEYRIATLSPVASYGTTVTTNAPVNGITALPAIAGPKMGTATYRIYFRSVDLAGNVEAPTPYKDIAINASADTWKPVTGISATPGRYATAQYFDLLPTDVGTGVQYTHYILTKNGVAANEASGTHIYTGTEGTYKLQYWSVDYASPVNNQEDTKTYDYLVDETAPTTVSNRNSNATTYSVAAAVILTARDDSLGTWGATGVSYISYSVDGGANKSFPNNNVNGVPLVGTVTIPRWYTNGPSELHTLRFNAVDKVGRIEAQHVETFTITATSDNTPPTTTTNRKPFYGTGTSYITLTPSDAGWGVKGTYYKLDNDTTRTGVSVNTGAPGGHTLAYWSIDNANNEELPHNTTTYTVDTTAPVSSIVATRTDFSGRADIALQAYDPPVGSGVAYTYYKIDGGSQGSGLSVPVPGPVSGSKGHRIQFWSVDAVGNTESPAKSIDITVTAATDTVPPVLSDTISLTPYSRPNTFTITASDAGQGVRELSYRRDGAFESTVTVFTGLPGGTASVTGLVSTGDTGGPRSIKYWATDQSGNTTTKTVNYSVFPDTAKPITTSNRQPIYSTGPANILLSASDVGWGVQYTHYILNKGGQVSVETSGNFINVADPLTGTLDCTLTYWSMDWARNTEDAHTETFTVKAVASRMTFSGIAPVEGSSVGTITTTAKISAAADLPITSVTMKVNDVATSTTTFTHTGNNAAVTLDLKSMTKRHYTLEVIFTTSDGRQNSKLWGFDCDPRTDYTPPVTDSDVKPAYFGDATVTLFPVDESGPDGVAFTRYQVDTGAWTTGTVIVVPAPVSGPAVPHDIRFRSTDKAGNEEDIKTRSFTVGAKDVTPPETKSTAVQFYKAAGTILLLATDVNGSGVDATFYLRENETTPTQSTMLGTGGEGSHNIRFWSIDRAGNREATQTAYYIVDLTKPHTDSDVRTPYDGPATIHLNPQDGTSASGIKDTFYRVDDGGQVSGTTINVAAPTVGSVQHTIYYWSVDNAGNVEDEESATFDVKAAPDRTSPVTSILNFTNGQAFAVPGVLTLKAVDNDGGWGVDFTTYILDSADPVDGLVVRTGGPGGHTLRYWSKDKAGNIESIKTATYTVTANDTQKPQTTAHGVTANQVFTGSTEITLTVTDNSNAPCVTWYRLDTGTTTGVRTEGTQVHVAGPVSGEESHTLLYGSTDINGNREDTQTVRFSNQMLLGDVTFSGMEPAAGTTIGIRNPTVRVHGHGNYSNIVGGTIDIDGTTVTSQITTGGRDATLSVAAEGLARNTLHRVTATFMDTTGGVDTTSWSFTVFAPREYQLPVTTSDITSYYRQPAVIHLFASDEVGGSGVAFTRYILDDHAEAVGTPPTTTITVTEAGPHSIKWWSVDADGNVESPAKEKGFNVDLTKPHTTSDVQLAYEGRPVITLTPDDFAKGSGIARTLYTVDGGNEQSGTVINSVDPPSAGSQWHTATFWSVDNAGNIEDAQEIRFNVFPDTGVIQPAFTALELPTPLDEIAPKTTSDAAASYDVPGSIHLSATDNTDGTGVAATYYILDGGVVTESTIVGTGGEGSHTLTFWSVDNAGVTEERQTVRYTVATKDATAPTTTAHAAATYAGVGEISLSAVDNDGGTGVAHIYYRLDGGAQVESTIIGVSGVGPHRLDYWSEDWAGNKEAVKTVQFTVTAADLVAPTTASDAQESYVGTATISLTATDNAGGSGVRTTLYRIDGGAAQQGVSVVVVPTSAEAVSHTVVFWSIDNGGVTEEQNSVTFTVAAGSDSVAPTTQSDIAPTYAGSATISLTASDNAGGSGVAHTYYRLEGGTQTEGTSISVPAPASGSAAHSIVFWSVDRAGNREPDHTVAFTVKAAAVGTSHIRFESQFNGTATMNVYDAQHVIVATHYLAYVAGNNMTWTFDVPSGQTYFLEVSWYDADQATSGSSKLTTVVMQPGATAALAY